MKRSSLMRMLTMICMLCLVAWLGAGCRGLGGTTHEQSPTLTINNYMQPPGAVTTAPEVASRAVAVPRAAEGGAVPGGAATGGQSADKIAAAGQIVLIFNQGNNPAGAGSNLPTEVARGWLQNALQGAKIPVGQTASTSDTGQQQAFANGTSPGSKPTATTSGTPTQ